MIRQLPGGIGAVLLFAAMLAFPREVFHGAEEGLLLWFQIVFPTLFPFMLTASLLLAGGGLKLIASLFGGICRKIFATSGNGSFAVLAGFLCGYPMGAKVTADLLREGKISYEEGEYLLSFCNNISPVFIMNFIVWKTLGRSDLLSLTLAVLLLVPAAASLIFRRFYLGGRGAFPDLADPKGSGDKRRLDFAAFDRCMMDSFESIVKVGGYIIFFSVLIALMETPGEKIPLLGFLLPSLEITNGVVMLHDRIADPALSYAAIAGLSAFGGLCAAAQTSCMIQGTGLKMTPYLIQKLTAAAAASCIAYFCIRFF